MYGFQYVTMSFSAFAGEYILSTDGISRTLFQCNMFILRRSGLNLTMFLLLYCEITNIAFQRVLIACLKG